VVGQGKLAFSAYFDAEILRLPQKTRRLMHNHFYLGATCLKIGLQNNFDRNGGFCVVLL
jgi:hypothetical protein